MAFRLQQLAVGNYILEYAAPSHGRNDLTEILCRVEGKVPVDEFGQHHVLKMFCCTKSTYGGAPTFSEKTVETTDDKVKFAPLSQEEAMAWIERNKFAEEITKGIATADKALRDINLKAEQLNMIAGTAQQALEGVAQ